MDSISKTIILSNYSYFPCIGGVENSIFSLYNSYTKMGYEVIIFCSDVGAENFTDKENIIRFRSHYFKSRYLKIFNVPFMFLDIIYKLIWIRKNKKIYMSLNRNHLVCLFVNFIFYKFSKNIFLMPGVSFLQNNKNNISLKINSSFFQVTRIVKLYLLNFIEKIAILTSSQAVVFSKNMATQVFKIHKKTNIVILNPGVDTKRFFPLPKKNKLDFQKKLNISNDLNCKLILGLGRFVKAKGFDILIKSLSNVQANVKLLLVGQGEEETNYRRIIEQLKLQNKVIILGKTSTPELFYQCADVFVLSSTYEPFGQTLLEAMSSGLPIVAFDGKQINTATIEICNNLAFYCEPEANTLANAIDKVLNLSTLNYESISNTSVKYVKQNYSWQTLAQKVLDL